MRPSTSRRRLPLGARHVASMLALAAAALAGGAAEATDEALPRYCIVRETGGVICGTAAEIAALAAAPQPQPDDAAPASMEHLSPPPERPAGPCGADGGRVEQPSRFNGDSSQPQPPARPSGAWLELARADAAMTTLVSVVSGEELAPQVGPTTWLRWAMLQPHRLQRQYVVAAVARGCAAAQLAATAVASAALPPEELDAHIRRALAAAPANSAMQKAAPPAAAVAMLTNIARSFAVVNEHAHMLVTGSPPPPLAVDAVCSSDYLGPAELSAVQLVAGIGGGVVPALDQALSALLQPSLGWPSPLLDHASDGGGARDEVESMDSDTTTAVGCAAASQTAAAGAGSTREGACLAGGVSESHDDTELGGDGEGGGSRGEAACAAIVDSDGRDDAPDAAVPTDDEPAGAAPAAADSSAAAAAGGDDGPTAAVAAAGEHGDSGETSRQATPPDGAVAEYAALMRSLRALVKERQSTAAATTAEADAAGSTLPLPTGLFAFAVSGLVPGLSQPELHDFDDFAGTHLAAAPIALPGFLECVAATLASWREGAVAPAAAEAESSGNGTSVDREALAMLSWLDVPMLAQQRCQQLLAVAAARRQTVKPGTFSPATVAAAMPPPPRALSTFARREAVRRGMLHAWRAYESHAFGADVLKPHSREAAGDLCKLGMTLVDSLDTLLLAGGWDEYIRARDWVVRELPLGVGNSGGIVKAACDPPNVACEGVAAQHATVISDDGGEPQREINLFETTIRVVGALLTAHEMTGEWAVLERADEVMRAMAATGAFATPTAVPYGTLTLQTGIRLRLTDMDTVGGVSVETATANGGTASAAGGIAAAESSLPSSRLPTTVPAYGAVITRFHRYCQLVREAVAAARSDDSADDADGGEGRRATAALVASLPPHVRLGCRVAAVEDDGTATVGPTLVGPGNGTVPGFGVVARGGSAYNPTWISGCSSLSEVTTLQLELQALAAHTGAPEYAHAAHAIMRVVQRKGPMDMLLPIYVDPLQPAFKDVVITLGARGDSAYEYALKQFVALGGWRRTEERLRALASFGATLATTARAGRAMSALLRVGQLMAAGSGKASQWEGGTLCRIAEGIWTRIADSAVGEGEVRASVLRDALAMWPDGPTALIGEWCGAAEDLPLRDEAALQPAAALLASALHREDDADAHGSESGGDDGSGGSAGEAAGGGESGAVEWAEAVEGLEGVEAQDIDDPTYLLDIYTTALCNIRDRLVAKSTPSGYWYLAEQEHSVFAGGGNASTATLSHKMDHLACFLPGTIALGLMHDVGHPALSVARLEELAVAAAQAAVDEALRAPDRRLALRLRIWSIVTCVADASDGAAVQRCAALADGDGEEEPAGLPPHELATLTAHTANQTVAAWLRLQQLLSLPPSVVDALVGALPRKPAATTPPHARHRYLLQLLLLDVGAVPSVSRVFGRTAAFTPTSACASTSDPVAARRDLLQLARRLTATCSAMYQRTTTGLAPEIVTFTPGADFVPNHDARHSLLRPETAESLYFMHRLTGDAAYQDAGWAMFTAMEKHARVRGGGYASVRDVMAWPLTAEAGGGGMEEDGADTWSWGQMNQHNKLESFALAETFKYLYLLQSDPPAVRQWTPQRGPIPLADGDAADPAAAGTVLDLRRWVFNTEAHPLRVEAAPLSQRVAAAARAWTSAG